MELRFADTNKEITEVIKGFSVDRVLPKTNLFAIARFKAKNSGKVIEIVGQCYHCGTIAKPLAEQSLDEMFSWCCEAAERESILVRQSQNRCQLCGKYSFMSRDCKECHDREQHERAWNESR